MKIYGYINRSGCLVDTGLSAKGAKRLATIVGATQTGYRIEYHVTITHNKVGLQWHPISSIEGKVALYKTRKMRNDKVCIILEEFPKTVKIDCGGDIRIVNKKSIVV